MSGIFSECLDSGDCGVTEGLILLDFVVECDVFSAKFRIQVMYMKKGTLLFTALQT
jgi:hypothetical protein